MQKFTLGTFLSKTITDAIKHKIQGKLLKIQQYGGFFKKNYIKKLCLKVLEVIYRHM